MDLKAVLTAYKRWAPVYNKTFGAVSTIGRKSAVDYINSRQGRVLEIGIGTGLALPHYGAHLEVTGIDVSADMLSKARKRISTQSLDHVVGIHKMDARYLDFPDHHFDTVVAMYLVSVAPEPERVISEMARVCKPGGEVVIVNHFARDKGPLAVAERAFAPFDTIIGWHSDFEIHRILGEDNLTIVEKKPLPPLGVFTFLRFQKAA